MACVLPGFPSGYSEMPTQARFRSIWFVGSSAVFHRCEVLGLKSPVDEVWTDVMGLGFVCFFLFCHYSDAGVSSLSHACDHVLSYNY